MKIKFAFFLTFMLIFKYSQSQDKKGNFNIIVKNSFTGIAVKSKIVISNTTYSKEQNTDASGNSSFKLSPGQYSVQISSPGYISQYSNYIVENSSTVLNIIASLDPIKYPSVKIEEGKSIISGYITDEETGLPLIKAKIISTLQNKTTYTNENGYFEISYSSFTKKGDENKILRTDITIANDKYNTIGYTNLPLYEDNLRLNLSVKRGNAKLNKKYSHKLIEGDTDESVKPILEDYENTYLQDSSISKIQNTLSQQGVSSCSPPPTIRLYHGANNGPCTSCLGCSVIEQMSLEQYVRTGLDDEWIASWQDQSLLAGAVAYRTYGAWHVSHPYGANYDIVAYPCRQHWDGNTSSAHTINAANSTVNEVLVNSSNAIAFSEYAAETNNFGCGDCFSGQGAWPCISDNVCCGKTPAGHGRGMCQWGSQRWAQQGQSYTWILDHYYNPGNYFRCNTSTSPPGSFSLTITPECNNIASQIRLNWTASSNATSYDVYRNNTLYSSGISGTQFINTSVTVGVTYSYYVKANSSSGSTNNSNGVLSATAPSCSNSLPGTFSLTVTPECNNTVSQIRLNWTASSNATTYDVYRNNILYSSGITGTQFINTSVTAGVTYSYYIKANNLSGSTNNSDGVLSAMAPNCSSPLPGDFILSATPQCNGTSSQIKLNWTASTNATSYEVFMNGNIGLGSTINTQLIVSLNENSTNSYYVKAINSSGSTNNSNGEVSVTSPNCSSSLPGDFILTITPVCNGTNSCIKLTWTASANATIYEVFMDGVGQGQNINTQQYICYSGGGTTNNFFVKASNSAGSTNNSNGTLSATSPNCSTLPGEFSLTITPVCNGTNSCIKLNWTASADATIYEVFMDGIGQGQNINTQQYICFSGGGSTNNYYVQASNLIGSTINSNGTLSAISPDCSTTQPATPPEPSAILTACNVMLKRTDTPPQEELWYWQGTICGTDTTLGHDSTFLVLSSGTYYLRAFNLNCSCWSSDCSSISVIVNPTTSVTWTGGTNIDWTNENNWSCGAVPDSTKDVIIPSGTLFSPRVPDGVNVSCKSLQIQTGAILTVGQNANLKVLN